MIGRGVPSRPVGRRSSVVVTGRGASRGRRRTTDGTATGDGGVVMLYGVRAKRVRVDSSRRDATSCVTGREDREWDCDCVCVLISTSWDDDDGRRTD